MEIHTLYSGVAKFSYVEDDFSLESTYLQTSILQELLRYSEILVMLLEAIYEIEIHRLRYLRLPMTKPKVSINNFVF